MDWTWAWYDKYMENAAENNARAYIAAYIKEWMETGPCAGSRVSGSRSLIKPWAETDESRKIIFMCPAAMNLNKLAGTNQYLKKSLSSYKKTNAIATDGKQLLSYYQTPSAIL